MAEAGLGNRLSERYQWHRSGTAELQLGIDHADTFPTTLE